MTTTCIIGQPLAFMKGHTNFPGWPSRHKLRFSLSRSFRQVIKTRLCFVDGYRDAWILECNHCSRCTYEVLCVNINISSILYCLDLLHEIRFLDIPHHVNAKINPSTPYKHVPQIKQRFAAAAAHLLAGLRIVVAWSIPSSAFYSLNLCTYHSPVSSTHRSSPGYH